MKDQGFSVNISHTLFLKLQNEVAIFESWVMDVLTASH